MRASSACLTQERQQLLTLNKVRLLENPTRLDLFMTVLMIESEWRSSYYLTVLEETMDLLRDFRQG